MKADDIVSMCKGIADMKDPDKRLEALTQCRVEINRIEKAAAQDFGYSLYEIQTAQEILRQVEAGISRLESGKRRREEAAEQRARDDGWQ